MLGGRAFSAGTAVKFGRFETVWVGVVRENSMPISVASLSGDAPDGRRVSFTDRTMRSESSAIGDQVRLGIAIPAASTPMGDALEGRIVVRL